MGAARGRPFVAPFSNKEVRMKLLLVEDEQRMSQALTELFRQEGYDVDAFADGAEGALAAESGIYDAIVLDVMLPGKDGFAVARDVRRAGVITPILMLTAKGEVHDKVAGLDSGADDYLTKPYLIEELLARVRALVRRGAGTPVERLGAGDIALDEATLMLENTRTGESVRLSDKEFRILEYFLRNRGRILTREQLAQRIWGIESDVEYNNVEVYLSFTRKKLAYLDANVTIKAVRGVGYEMRVAEEAGA